MEKSEYRVLIKHYFLRKKTITETKKSLDKYYGNSSPSLYMIHKWFTDFRCGRTSTEDAPRSGRPIEVTTSEMITKIHDFVLEDRRVKLREIAKTVNISCERVSNILHEHLHMRKISARWVPRLLTVDQKRQRMKLSQANLQLFEKKPDEFLRRFITVDETWIHFYTPETKQQSKQWVEAGGSAPKKAKVIPSAGKVMATVFWDAQGIIFIDFLQKGKTINGAYYSSLLDQLNEEIKTKRPHLAKKKILFHHDNAPAHSSAIATAKLVELRYELVPHPPYSPDLAPSDYYLFPNMKIWLGGRRFWTDSEVISETNAYFEDLGKDYYKAGIKNLQHRLTKCIALKGDYVEK